MLLHPPCREVVIVTGKICIQMGEEGHDCCSLSPLDSCEGLVLECSLKILAVTNGRGYQNSDIFRLFIFGLHMGTKYCITAYLLPFLCFASLYLSYTLP